MFDPRCLELAEAFLEGEAPRLQKVRDLAQTIQTAIEEWLECENAGTKTDEEES